MAEWVRKHIEDKNMTYSRWEFAPFALSLYDYSKSETFQKGMRPVHCSLHRIGEMDYEAELDMPQLTFTAWSEAEAKEIASTILHGPLGEMLFRNPMFQKTPRP